MKKARTLFFVLFLVWSICKLYPTLSYAQDQSVDRLGKVRGWIIDPLTKKSVNEAFYIEFSDALKPGDFESKFRKGTMSDVNGFFEISLPAHSYVMEIKPLRGSKRYCVEPSTLEGQKSESQIQVAEGKIVEIKKTATIGGFIKAKIADLNGNTVNIKEHFKDLRIIPKIYISGYSSSLSDVISENESDSLLDGEIVSQPLFPDKYKAELKIIGLGFQGIKLDNLIVESGRTTHANFVINPFDNTGIEGKIFFKDCVSVKDEKISFFKLEPYVRRVSCYTDNTGYFCIKGLLPGKYQIGLIINWRYWKSDFFDIKNGELSKRDFYLDFSKSE